MNSARVSGSLRNRLVLTLLGGAALLALLLVLAVRSHAIRVAQEGQDNILLASATSILDSAAIRDGSVQVDIPYAAFSMLSTPADDRLFYAVFQDGQFMSGYAELTLAEAGDDLGPNFRAGHLQDSPVRIIEASRTIIGAEGRRDLQLLLAQTQDALSETLDRISRDAALFGGGFFLLAALLSLGATKATIAPLSRLTASVTRRGPQDLRPFQSAVPQEMAPLVTSLNSLMGRLDQTLSQSEDFIAEAAHRVRTPLATVRSRAEATLQRVEKEENREAVRAMIKAIDESSRAAGQLLDHAMITFRADHLERDDLDLAVLVRELTERLAPIADMRDLRLHVKGDQLVPMTGDQILIQNALRNLIDNAIKYGPAESVIEIAIIAAPRPQVRIRDHGPGFHADEIETLTSRFKRGRNAAKTIGSGLGLTIALDVATAHGGDLTLHNHPEGGACVTLSF
ncbi:sensor histidine kinase [Sulfitobacter sp. NFXS29]|uniref:sensor histidine kinase n=1 Tax=Sulfitobacter sp. NFXS29 TaxID=2818438 RepID=UPI0032DE920B